MQLGYFLKNIVKYRLKRHIITLGIFLAGLLLLLVKQAGVLATPEENFRDWVVEIAANQNPQAPEVVVVDLDESSIHAVGPWPWPRATVAELLEVLLTDYRARAVAVDVVFPEPADAAGDERLAALGSFAPVVLSQVFDFSLRSQALAVGALAGHQQLGQLGQLKGQPGRLPYTQATGYLANHAGLAQVPHVGNIGFQSDADGKLRKASHIVAYGQQAYPSLALATAMLAHGFQPGADYLNRPLRIPFTKALSAYTVVPAHLVLKQEVEPAYLQGKVVFVGSSALGLGDRVATPIGAQTSGVFAHVALYEGLLAGYPTALQQSSLGTGLGLLWLLAVCGFAAARFDRQAAVVNISMVVLAALLWTAIATWLAANFMEANLSAPYVVLLGLLLLLVPYDWQSAQARSKLLLKALNHHISPTLARELIESGQANPLAPRAVEITALVVDVENYTGRISNLPPEGVAEVTRDILNIIGQGVISNRGTMDKFTGDGGVAFWGAPLPMPDHADLAVQAALNILDRVNAYNNLQQAAGKPPLRVRIGIDSGPVIVGDFGWSERAIYTALGLCMGRAARLEQLGKTYNENLIVGPKTVELSRNYTYEHIASPVLRGLQQQVDIFRVKPAHHL